MHCHPSAHFWVTVDLNAMPPSKKLPGTLHQISYDVKLPCKDRCFLGAEETQVCGRHAMFLTCSAVMLQELPRWSDDDIATFRVIFALAPDLSSCDLAMLCLKPCCEVTAQRISRQVSTDEVNRSFVIKNSYTQTTWKYIRKRANQKTNIAQ